MGQASCRGQKSAFGWRARRVGGDCAPDADGLCAPIFFLGGGLVRISSLRVLSSRMLAHMLLAEQVIMGSGSLHKG